MSEMLSSSESSRVDPDKALEETHYNTDEPMAYVPASFLSEREDAIILTEDPFLPDGTAEVAADTLSPAMPDPTGAESHAPTDGPDRGQQETSGEIAGAEYRGGNEAAVPGAESTVDATDAAVSSAHSLETDTPLPTAERSSPDATNPGEPIPSGEDEETRTDEAEALFATAEAPPAIATREAGLAMPETSGPGDLRDEPKTIIPAPTGKGEDPSSQSSILQLAKGSLLLAKGSLMIAQATVDAAQSHPQHAGEIAQLARESVWVTDLGQSLATGDLPTAPAPVASPLPQATTSAFAPAPRPQAEFPRSELTEEIDAIFEEFNRPDSPGCALSILQGPEVIYQQGYGMANIDYGVPNTPTTAFHAGSIANHMIGLCVLMLEREGKLSLDEDIRAYIPELPELGAKVTPRHLIYHISGIRDDMSLLPAASWRKNYLKTGEDLLYCEVLQDPQDCQPEVKFQYSCTGYLLLMLIVQNVTGMSFRRYSEERLFRPLGMAQTQFYKDSTYPVANRSYAYKAKSDDGYQLDTTSIQFTGHGLTGIFTTVNDLSTWATNFYEKRVGGEGMLEGLYRQATLKNGHKLPYAMGLVHRTHRSLKTIEHGGNHEGYQSFFIWFPDAAFTVILLSNWKSFNGAQMALRVSNKIIRYNKHQLVR